MPDLDARIKHLLERSSALAWCHCTDMPGRLTEQEYHRRVTPVWDELEGLIRLRDRRRLEARAA